MGMARRTALGVLVMLAAACGPGSEGQTVDAAPRPSATPGLADTQGFALTDYTNLDHWLCHPDKTGDACDVDIDRTVVSPDGATQIARTERPETPPVDCFYVYPTVSEDITPNSDLNMGPAETGVVAAQFAPFARECRLFARPTGRRPCLH